MSILNEQDARNYAAKNAESITGKKLLVIIPDKTRSGGKYIGQVIRGIYDAVGTKVDEFTVLFALGTHGPMEEESIHAYLKFSAEEIKQHFPKIKFANHEWRDKSKLRTIGNLSREDLLRLSGNCFDLNDVRRPEGIPVEINYRVVEADEIVIIGPVLPHEVVGCSGGNKYFFPGCSGADVTNHTHWLGASVTIPYIIGRIRTPVRDVIDYLASMIKVKKNCFALVVSGDTLHNLHFGTPEAAYEQAARGTLEVNAKYVDRKYKTVLAICSKKYPEIWTGGKCSYKLQGIVEDGGDLIIYAPHMDKVSESWGNFIEKVGYHCLPYIQAHFAEYLDQKIGLGVLAHVTHVKGTGKYENGIETPNVNIIMATGLTKQKCAEINLDYVDYHSVDIEKYRNDPDCLVVDDAGEILYIPK